MISSLRRADGARATVPPVTVRVPGPESPGSTVPEMVRPLMVVGICEAKVFPVHVVRLAMATVPAPLRV